MQKRILLLVIVCIAVVLLSVGYFSHLSVQQSIEHSLHTHRMIAEIVARDMDHVLEENITRLHDVSSLGLVELGDGDWAGERLALKTAYEYSIFTDGLFMLDLAGNIVLTYPHREGLAMNLLDLPHVAEALKRRRTVVTGLYALAGQERKVLFVVAPLKDLEGRMVGLVGGEINPSNYLFMSAIKDIPADEESLIEIVDGAGRIITSNDASRMYQFVDHNGFIAGLLTRKEGFVGRCYRCHGAEEKSTAPEVVREADMVAVVPLKLAPWGIIVRDPMRIVYAPATSLRRAFLVISLVIVAAAIVLAVGLSKSIAEPLGALTDHARRIAEGDLREPIRVRRKDEIGTLAQSFDLMRQRLAESLESICRHNAELEQRVRQRTAELQERKAQLSRLLDKGMKAQEEERRRIARELHDETSQTLAALGMSLEIASIAQGRGALSPEMLYELRLKAGGLVDGINRIIHDLRPPVLDDLGLESGVSWLLERTLGRKGIRYTFQCEGLEGAGGIGNVRLDPALELGLFRVLQEALQNVARHSRASRVCVCLRLREGAFSAVLVDDGLGFDVERALSSYGKDTADSLTGLGLLGIRERLELLGGTFEIESFPHEGTYMGIIVPVPGVTARGQGEGIKWTA